MQIEKLASSSEIHAFINVHIPKTGGSSIGRWFSTHYGTDRVFFHRSRDLETGEISEAIEDLSDSDLKEKKFISGHFDYGKHLYWGVKKTLYLSVLRDPVERIISDYLWNREMGRPEYKKIAQERDINEYIQYKIELPSSKLVKNSQIFHLSLGYDLRYAKALIDSDYLFVCTTGQINEAQNYLSRWFGKQSSMLFHEKNNSKTSSNLVSEVDPSLRSEIENRCELDRRLVDWAAKRFNLIQNAFGNV